MSSTTDSRAGSRRRSVGRGQALVVFALIVTGLLLGAALAIDVGMVMLERRDQQNAADAAALAGARELPSATTARTKARTVATQNGFTQGQSGTVVSVGATSTRVIVTISRPVTSYFASLAGITSWDVRSTAVAISLQDQPPFAAMTALNEHACGAVQITGSGRVSSWGDVQINSDGAACDSGDALLVSGQGNLDLQHDGLACWVVAANGEPGVGYAISGKGQGKYCDPPQPGVPITFPVNGMPENDVVPIPPLQIGGATKAIPNGCPGTAGYTANPPVLCQFQSSYKDTVWRLYPGLYRGGIRIQSGGTFYLEPGIYHLEHGGFTVTGNGATAISVDPGGTTLGGGVLLFNTTSSSGTAGPIRLEGGSATINLWPLGGIDDTCSGESEGWNRYLIFQDPAVSTPIVINGGSNDMQARGLIFAPGADVQVNGGSGTLTIDAIIADTFKINGNGGNINVLYDNCALPTYTGYGLVV